MVGGNADETWGWGVRRPWIGTPGFASPCPFVAPCGLTASGKGMNGGGKVGGEYGTGESSAHLPRPRGAVSGADQVGQGSYVTLFCRRRKTPNPSLCHRGKAEGGPEAGGTPTGPGCFSGWPHLSVPFGPVLTFTHPPSLCDSSQVLCTCCLCF